MTAIDWLRAVRAQGCRPKLSDEHGPRLRYEEWDALSESRRAFALDNEGAIADALRAEQRAARRVDELLTA